MAQNAALIRPNPARPAPVEVVASWYGYTSSNALTAYEVLNISLDAVSSEPSIATLIQVQYQTLSRCFQPDLFSATGLCFSRCKEIMQKLNEANEAVREAVRRRDYDISIGLDTQHGDGSYGMPGSINSALLQGAYGQVLVAMSKLGDIDLKLPSIVVVGYESDGKSSTLERLAMRSAFPRGVEFTTRMPIAMRLRFRRHENVVVVKHIRIGGDGQREVLLTHTMEPRADVPLGAAQDVVDAGEIGLMIQRIILAAHPNDDGRQVLANELVEIEIRAPNVPDLDLVDLPGVVAAPLAVHRATTDLVRSYIRNENCLVLCVLPSGVATLRGSPILTIMEEVATSSPTLWERTIVILTKVDTGDRARLANRLRPGACELACIPARQIVPVINRSVGDPRSIIDALEDERRWFRDWCADSQEFNPADMGVDGMLSHLERMVNSHIVRVWVPQQVAQLSERAERVATELKVLGQDPAELSADVLVRAVAEAARCAMLRVITSYQETKRLTRQDAHRVALVERWAWVDSCDPTHAIFAGAGRWLTDERAQFVEECRKMGEKKFDGVPQFENTCVDDSPLRKEWATSYFLDNDLAPGISGLVRGVLHDAFSEFVGFDEHALVLRRFGGLKEQLLGRVDSALAQDTARLRELLRQRAELVCAVDHSGPGAFPDGAVKLFIVQRVLFPFAQQGDSHVLFSRSGLLQPTEEDADTASTRLRLSQEKDNIARAIRVLEEVGLHGA